MNYQFLISLNIFSALVSFSEFEQFFQFSLLFVSIVLSLLKCLEMIINLRIKRKELKTPAVVVPPAEPKEIS